MKKIGIIGPGAVGSCITVQLLATEHKVYLIGRRNACITYQDPSKNVNMTLNVVTASDITEPLDIIFIAVKIPHLDGLYKQINHLTQDTTIVILAQNGYGQHFNLPFPNMYQAVTYISGQKTDQHVIHFRDEILHLQRDDNTESLKKTLASSGLSLVLHKNIEVEIWYKLLVNLAINTVTALGIQPASILKQPHIYSLCVSLLKEGYIIAKHSGINFSEDVIDEILTIYQGYPDDMGTSMYYDVLANTPLEIDGIQGFLYRQARKYKLTTPHLDTIYALLLSRHHVFSNNS
ncbi:oxidoreductase [Staphylococcus sp. GDY8P54P]|uniref:oxidoreductase n=1 Tax=Staphylococcus sp. GDY8P54P TaxID=2804125 RepID=UPI001AEBB1CD|nr:oxidoreductase [Staphylococcus sp. GDY8P54P]